MAGHEIGTLTLTGGPTAGAWTITAHDQDATVVTTTQGDASHDEIGTITLTCGSNGGTWKITTQDGDTTDLAYNASAAVVQAALRAVAVTHWNVATIARTGSGTTASPYVYAFDSGAHGAVTDLTTTATSLTKTTSALAYNVSGADAQVALRTLATGWAAATVSRTGTGTSVDPYVYAYDSGANGALVDLTCANVSLTFSFTYSVGGEFI